jgi:hypothetical protein
VPVPIARRRLYEEQVRALAGVADRLLSLGWPEEKVARHLVDARNRLKIVARRADDPAIVALIEARNFARYGHPVGPTADQLVARYGSWSAVIEAAARPATLS